MSSLQFVRSSPFFSSLLGDAGGLRLRIDGGGVAGLRAHQGETTPKDAERG